MIEGALSSPRSDQGKQTIYASYILRHIYLSIGNNSVTVYGCKDISTSKVYQRLQGTTQVFQSYSHRHQKVILSTIYIGGWICTPNSYVPNEK
ncbi:hypothetical protein K1719_011262 [Acacia pycnantha]|nr:hypothetical protein K1719_011262 [Acacia pycnantha]